MKTNHAYFSMTRKRYMNKTCKNGEIIFKNIARNYEKLLNKSVENSY